jgi:hypothetical protein
MWLQLIGSEGKKPQCCRLRETVHLLACKLGCWVKGWGEGGGWRRRRVAARVDWMECCPGSRQPARKTARRQIWNFSRVLYARSHSQTVTPPTPVGEREEEAMARLAMSDTRENRWDLAVGSRGGRNGPPRLTGYQQQQGGQWVGDLRVRER